MSFTFADWWRAGKPAEVDEFKEYFVECWETAQGNGVAAIDCRLCAAYRGPGDGCGSLLTCSEGNMFKPTTPVWCWE